MPKTTTTHHSQTAEKPQPIRGMVSINGWQYDRHIVIEEERVSLEVTVRTCSHCPTCQGRVREFQTTLARKPEVQHDWQWQSGSSWVVLPKPASRNALDFLKEVLELRRISMS